MNGSLQEQEQAKFDHEVSELINSGAMADKGWKPEKMVHETQHCLKMWKRLQEGIQYTRSRVSYRKLKAKRKGKKLEVLKAAQEGVVKDFTVIQLNEKHHVIVDRYGQVLGYRYRINDKLLETLSKSTSKLPRKRVKAGVRGGYPTRHYTVWRDYALVPRESSEFKRDLPASRAWCNENANLFRYLSNGLRMISPKVYARYASVKPYLEKEMKLKPLCGAWFGAAINEEVTGSTSTHLDWGDHGFNCVVPWGEYEGGGLILWPLRMVIKLQPGDAFFFMGSLIAHNVHEVVGVRNSIDLFCHKTMLTWKDRCKKEEEEIWKAKIN
jgi:hypothetical protein